MYYESNRSFRKRGRKRRGCFSRLFRLGLVALVIWALIAVAPRMIVGLNLFQRDQDALEANRGLPNGYTNILLLGCDKDDGGGSRSDAILVASIGGSGDIKLTSVMRDTLLEMPGEGTHKINAAYRLGGAALVMRTLNRAFSLNLTRYAAIDFEGIAKVIDALGGIELNITQAERDQINQGLRGAYAKRRVFNGVLMEPLTEYGEGVHMSGTHAMFYSRIRKIDSDYKRAERQRILLNAMLQKLRRNRNPVTLGFVASAALQNIETNLSAMDIATLGLSVLGARSDVSQFRIPAEGTYRAGTSGGVWAIRADLEANRSLLYQFIYG